MITKDNVKVRIYGATTITLYDTLIDSLIVEAKTIVENYTNIKFSGASAYSTITDEIKTANGSNFYLNRMPIRTVTAIKYLDSNFEWVADTDEDLSKLYFDKTKVFCQYSKSPYAKQYKVSYTCGYKDSEVPAEIDLALLLIVTRLFNQRQNIGLNNLSELDNSYTFDFSENKDVQKILNNYRCAYVF